MFKQLCKDIIQEIFEFDPTYRVVFSKSLNTLVTPNMKVLQNFLNHSTLSSLFDVDEGRFESMKEIDVRPTGINNQFIEVVYDGTKKTVFSILTLYEKHEFDSIGCSSEQLVLQKYLTQLPLALVAEFAEISEEELQSFIGDEHDRNVRNRIMYGLLGKKGYIKLTNHLMESGQYNCLFHQFLFERWIVDKMDDIYFMEDSDNYTYFRHKDEFYMVFWNTYTKTMFM